MLLSAKANIRCHHYMTKHSPKFGDQMSKRTKDTHLEVEVSIGGLLSIPHMQRSLFVDSKSDSKSKRILRNYSSPLKV